MKNILPLILLCLCVSCKIEATTIKELPCEQFTADTTLSRCNIPHGWLVVGYYRLTFIPDEKHEWKL